MNHPEHKNALCGKVQSFMIKLGGTAQTPLSFDREIVRELKHPI